METLKTIEISLRDTTPTVKMKIAGMHPAEYAAQWGAGNSGDGALFYNVAHFDGWRTVHNPEWTKLQWLAFAGVVRRQAIAVHAAIQTPEGRTRTGWKESDVRDLLKLAQWAQYVGNTLETRSNWR